MDAEETKHLTKQEVEILERRQRGPTKGEQENARLAEWHRNGGPCDSTYYFPQSRPSRSGGRSM
jgi:hypothetical protein